jgi:thioesterase domain-containing protein
VPARATGPARAPTRFQRSNRGFNVYNTGGSFTASGESKSESGMQALCAELGQTWHREIPISAAMGIEILECDAHELVVEAPLAPNINVHGTAFAGSLYAVTALTGWGMMWLALKARGVDASIVLAQGHIRYVKAVRGAIRCVSRFEPDAQQRALERLAESGRSVFALEASISADGEPAIRFEGKYAVRRR